MEKTTFDNRPTCAQCIHRDEHFTETGDRQLVCAYNPPGTGYVVIPIDQKGNVNMLARALWPPIQPGWRCSKIEIIPKAH